MSQQQAGFASWLIADPLEFARRGELLSGAIEISAFSRLREELMDTQGSVQVEVVGSEVGDDRFLLVSIEAEPRVECQRCLAPLALDLALNVRFLLVPLGQPMPDDELEDDSFDPILAERNLDVQALVEDELLLALPISPRHEVCDTPQPRERDDSASPFAALANLRGAGKKV